MFTKMKSLLRDYFLPEQPNETIFYGDEFGMYAYYNHSEADIVQDTVDTSYAQRIPEKP